MNALRRLWHRVRGHHTWRYEPASTSGHTTIGPWLVCDPCEVVRVLRRT